MWLQLDIRGTLKEQKKHRLSHFSSAFSEGTWSDVIKPVWARIFRCKLCNCTLFPPRLVLLSDLRVNHRREACNLGLTGGFHKLDWPVSVRKPSELLVGDTPAWWKKSLDNGSSYLFSGSVNLIHLVYNQLAYTCRCFQVATNVLFFVITASFVLSVDPSLGIYWSEKRMLCPTLLHRRQSDLWLTQSVVQHCWLLYLGLQTLSLKNKYSVSCTEKTIIFFWSGATVLE